MKKRQLFRAIDSEGIKVNIDDVDKASDAESGIIYSCPHCKKEVVPKCGDKNVWHFAHKDKVCEYLNIKSSDGLDNDKLNFSNTNSSDVSSIEIGTECRDFLCVKCKKKFNKRDGLKWSTGEYVCKDCFMQM